MTKLRDKGYGVAEICDFMGISRQAYYKCLFRNEHKSSLYNDLEQVVIKNRLEKSRVGLRTIFYKEGLHQVIGLNQFEQEMSFRGYALKPYRSPQKTTDSRGHHFKFHNLISGMQVNNENQVIVGDIAYLKADKKDFFLFHFIDYYTLEMKGLVGSDNLMGINAERCLRQVYIYNKKSKYNHKLILHTDAGGQYRSLKFQKMLRDAGIVPSHAKSCFENGLSERANGIIKNEYLVDYEIKSKAHLSRVLKNIKIQINEVWPSRSLGYRTPKQFAQEVRQLPEGDRPVKIIKSVE